MNVVNDRTVETHYWKRFIDLDRAEPMPHVGFSHRGKQYKPTSAVAEWQHGAEIKSITVHGRLLKKDGTPGEQRVRNFYRTPANPDYGASFGADAPAWLLEIFNIEPKDNES